MEQTNDLQKGLYQRLKDEGIKVSYNSYDTFKEWSFAKDKEFEEIQKINKKVAEIITPSTLPTGEIPLSGEMKDGANFVESGIAMTSGIESSGDNTTIDTKDYTEKIKEKIKEAFEEPKYEGIKWMADPYLANYSTNINSTTKVASRKEKKQQKSNETTTSNYRSLKEKIAEGIYSKSSEPEPGLTFGSAGSIYGGIGRSPFTVGIPGEEHLLILTSPEGIEMLRINSNGDIYVKGNLAAIDSQIVDAMRNFLRMNKMHP